MAELNYLHYQDVSSMVANCDMPYTLAGNSKPAQRSLLAERGEDWLGITGGAVAVRRALHEGFAKGADSMRKFAGQLTDKLPRALGHNRQRCRGDFGDEIDIHSINRGACDKAWTFAARRIKVGSGIIRLAVDIGGNSSQSPESLKWRGIAGAALAQVMEKAGYSVEIVACFAVRGLYSKAPNSMISVVVKPRSSKTNIELLASTIGLTGFFRTFGFAQLYRLADNRGKVAHDSLGYYLNCSGVLPVPEKITQLFVDGSVNDADSALAWIKQSVLLLQHSTIGKER